MTVASDAATTVRSGTGSRLPCLIIVIVVLLWPAPAVQVDLFQTSDSPGSGWLPCEQRPPASGTELDPSEMVPAARCFRVVRAACERFIDIGECGCVGYAVRASARRRWPWRNLRPGPDRG